MVQRSIMVEHSAFIDSSRADTNPNPKSRKAFSVQPIREHDICRELNPCIPFIDDCELHICTCMYWPHTHAFFDDIKCTFLLPIPRPYYEKVMLARVACRPNNNNEDRYVSDRGVRISCEIRAKLRSRQRSTNRADAIVM